MLVEILTRIISNRGEKLQRIGSVRLPTGLYSADPALRLAALKEATPELRRRLLREINWPMYSPGTINAWLVFIGPSPGASPSSTGWDYDPRPAVGGPHGGVADYVDRAGFWNGLRMLIREIFPTFKAEDAYALTMLRNLDVSSAAVAPTGQHMQAAAEEVMNLLGHLARPRLVISLGGARKYTDRVFRASDATIEADSGVLFTASAGHERPWFSMTGHWPEGDPFLYVSPAGIHPSITHVSREDAGKFLRQQARIARDLS